MAIKSDRPPSEPPSTNSGSEPSQNDPPSYSDVTSGHPSQPTQIVPGEPIMTEQHQQPAVRHHDAPAPTSTERTPFLGNIQSPFEEADKRARKRAVWAWVCGIIIWGICALVFGQVVASSQRKSRGGGSAGHGGSSNGGTGGGEKKTYPGTLHCSSYQEVTRASGPGPFTVSNIKLDLPVYASFDLFFHAEGPHSHGSVEFLTEGPPGGEGWVSVNALWDDLDILHSSEVCVVRNGEEIGVQLWTPTLPEPTTAHLSFAFTFHLPPISLNSLRVDASIFSIYLPDGAPQLKDSLTLHTTNAPIVISASVETRKIDLLTSNAVISFLDVGTINGKDSFSAVTKNGAIKADTLVTLRSPNLQLITSNGAIEAQAIDSLGNLTALNTNGKITLGVELIASDNFNVKVATSNAPVDVAFLTQKLGSRLIGSFASKNGRVDLELDQEYQGSFEVAYGSFLTPKITPPVDIYNKWHDGKRSFTLTGVGKGETSWADGKKKAFGDVKVRTSNARATLAFECDKTF